MTARHPARSSDHSLRAYVSWKSSTKHQKETNLSGVLLLTFQCGGLATFALACRKASDSELIEVKIETDQVVVVSQASSSFYPVPSPSEFVRQFHR